MRLSLSRVLVAFWVLLAAWLGARVAAELRSLIMPPMVPALASPAPAADPWLGRYWAVEQSGDLPLTRLPLQWLGAIRALPIDGSVIVLGYQNRQYTLTIGKELAADILLVGIDQQGLVLDNQGRRERLLWPVPGPLVGLQRVGAEAPAPASTRQRLDLDALLARLQATPVLEDGALVGYRLQPGADAALFDRLGLETGDVLRRIDQVPVADTAALIARMPHWREADTMILDLQRRGQPLTLTVELSL